MSPAPTITVLSCTAYIGGAYGSRYVALSARELGVTTLRDSVMLYYAVKADVFQLRREPAGARVYYDSIRTLLEVAAAERTGRADAAAPTRCRRGRAR